MAIQTSSPIIYPTHINTYIQCPERYFHQRVERRRVKQPFSPALAKGIAIHEILAQAVRAYGASLRQHDGPAVPYRFIDEAQTKLPRDQYTSALAWNADAESVVESVRNGLSYLDDGAGVLATEVTYQFPYMQSNGCPPFTLAAKVDLVLLRHDEQGVPFLDVVDYKSGTTARTDPIQELAARIVVKQNAGRFNASFDYIQNTTLHVGVGAVTSQVVDEEECGRRWSQVKEVVSAITAGTDWAPNPSPLCEWCPYFNNGCTLAVEPTSGRELGAWLDSVAD